MKVILPFRGEFGHKVLWHAPAVHAIEGDRYVYIEPGDEALYPGCEWRVVDAREDGKRRESYVKDMEFVRAIDLIARARFPRGEILMPDKRWPRKYFVPVPHVPHDVDCDLVVVPRRRAYGDSKNWDAWPDVVNRLVEVGIRVFAVGAPDSSYDVDCSASYDYDRHLDASLAAIRSARLVLATNSGASLLALMCGKPLVVVSASDGLVAPGPVLNEHGGILQLAYWPIRREYYDAVNHRNAKIRILRHGWEHPADVVAETVAILRRGDVNGLVA